MTKILGKHTIKVLEIETPENNGIKKGTIEYEAFVGRSFMEVEKEIEIIKEIKSTVVEVKGLKYRYIDKEYLFSGKFEN